MDSVTIAVFPNALTNERYQVIFIGDGAGVVMEIWHDTERIAWDRIGSHAENWLARFFRGL